MIGAARTDALPTTRAASLCAAVAGFAAFATHVLGPPAGDAPAHVFQTLAFVRHGYALWDNYWYAGSYAYVLYSVAYYPLAAVGAQTFPFHSLGAGMKRKSGCMPGGKSDGGTAHSHPMSHSRAIGAIHTTSGETQPCTLPESCR